MRIRCRVCGHRDRQYKPNGTRSCRECARRRERIKRLDPSYVEKKNRVWREWWSQKPKAWKQAYTRARYLRQDPKERAWRAARGRAKALGIPFTISLDQLRVKWGSVCPVFETAWGPGGRRPSLDQLIPGKGYTPENTAVISMRANRLKQNASVSDLERLVTWLRGMIE